MMKSSRKFLLAILLALGLVGCSSSDYSDLTEFVSQTKAKKGGRIDPLPEIKPYDTYLYNVQELRDPFTPPSFAIDSKKSLAGGEGANRPDRFRRREPLEAFPLDSLLMVGIISKDGNTWGLVQTEEGVIHKVSVGNYMGQNHGKIIAIAEDKVSLVELVLEGEEDWIERDAAIAIGEVE